MVEASVVLGLVAISCYLLYFGDHLNSRPNLELSKNKKYWLNIKDLGVACNLLSLIVINAILFYISTNVSGADNIAFFETMLSISLGITIVIIIMYLVVYLMFRSAMFLGESITLQHKKIQHKQRGSR